MYGELGGSSEYWVCGFSSYSGLLVFSMVYFVLLGSGSPESWVSDAPPVDQELGLGFRISGRSGVWAESLRPGAWTSARSA